MIRNIQRKQVHSSSTAVQQYRYATTAMSIVETTGFGNNSNPSNVGVYVHVVVHINAKTTKTGASTSSDVHTGKTQKC